MMLIDKGLPNDVKGIFKNESRKELK